MLVRDLNEAIRADPRDPIRMPPPGWVAPLRGVGERRSHIGGQANVKRWVDELMPLLLDGDPLGVDSFASHHLPLEQAPEAYEKFQKKQDGFVKVLLQP